MAGEAPAASSTVGNDIHRIEIGDALNERLSRARGIEHEPGDLSSFIARFRAGQDAGTLIAMPKGSSDHSASIIWFRFEVLLSLPSANTPVSQWLCSVGEDDCCHA